MKLLVVIPLLVLSARAQELSDGDAEEQPRTLCGRILADARVFYCYSSDGKKRSYDSTRVATMNRLSVTYPWVARMYQRAHAQEEQDELVHQLEQQKRRQQALALRGKRDSGLAVECCLKPCYINELLSYC